MPSAGSVWRPHWRDGGNREASVGSTIGELALLQRQHSLLQEELLRLRDAESRFKDSERARAKLEKQVRHMKVCGGSTSGSQQLGEQEPQVRTSAAAQHYGATSRCSVPGVLTVHFSPPACSSATRK